MRSSRWAWRLAALTPADVTIPAPIATASAPDGDCGLSATCLRASPDFAASQLGARDASEAAPAQAGLFAGIPQDGLALGRDGAPVTLVEYADLQCPYCAQWSLRTLPVLVSRYVRTGRLRIVFRGLAFIGPDSETALRTAIAADRGGRLWDVVHGLYGRQGGENAGWVSAALVEAATEAGLDPARLAEQRGEPWVDAQVEASRALAAAAGVRATPSFQLGRTGGPLELVRLESLGPRRSRPRRRAAPAVTERRIGAFSTLLALAGAAVTGYLLYVRGTGATIACATGGCETVQGSRYSEIFGVPVAAVGLVEYAALFATALAVGERARLAHAVMVLGAFAFSGYLLVLQGTVIGAVCDWCLAGDVLVTCIAALALVRLKVS